MTLQVGTKVKHSGYVLMKKRDYWNRQGREPMKSGAKADLDKAIEERGVITRVLEKGLEVKWDSGMISQCLSYLVEEVTA